MNISITHQQLAELLGGRLVSGDPTGVVTGLNSIAEAAPGEVTFLGNVKYVGALKKSQASAVLVDPGFSDFASGVAYIAVENPTLAFSAVIRHFSPPPIQFVPGVHPTAIVAATATLDPAKVSIGPNVVIEDDVVIGDGSDIRAGVFIGRGTRLGTDCLLYPNCSVREYCTLGNRVTLHCSAAIGTDGFGYQFSGGKHVKIEQVGTVQIDDDVEIGSGTVVDRARFGRTWIGEGTKIDNLVQVAHNVTLGKHCLVCGQVGISGSTQIGDGVILAGQVGVAGHLKVASQTTFMAKSAVLRDIEEPGMYVGNPAAPAQNGRKALLLVARLPELLNRIKDLERKVAAQEPG